MMYTQEDVVALARARDSRDCIPIETDVGSLLYALFEVEEHCEIVVAAAIVAVRGRRLETPDVPLGRTFKNGEAAREWVRVRAKLRHDVRDASLERENGDT